MKRFTKGFVMLLLTGIALSHGLITAADELARDDFDRVVRSLSSIASEATLFLDQLEQGRLTDAYAKTHLNQLNDQLDDERHKLQQPFPASLKPQRDNAIVWAGALAAEVNKLNGRLQDKTIIRKAKDEVARIRHDLAELRG